MKSSPHRLSILALAALAGCSSGTDDAPAPPDPGPDITAGAYLPDDGLIVVELESGTAAGAWAEETALTGFTGTSYLRWTGPNLFNTPNTDPFGFDLWIEDPGIYQFRIHNRHDDPDSTMSNDCWVRMDDGPWVKVFSHTRGVWTWATRHEFAHDDKPDAQYDLTAGNHRIEFSGRSFDFSIDRFHLYDTGVANPLDTSHPESSQHGGTGGTPPPPGSEGPNRRLVLGPVVAESGEGTSAWDAALAATPPVARTVDVRVVGDATVWTNDRDPLFPEAGLGETLRALPGRFLGRDDVRWTFEASPVVVPSALDDLARIVRAADPDARPLALRIAPDELVRRWPDVQHSVFDEVVLLRTVGADDGELDAARQLLERAGRAFEVRVGADPTRD